MNLTGNFTLTELTASSTAERLGIDNAASPEIITHLTICALGLEKVRALLGQPMHIDSGYRCAALNRVVGGAANSAHMSGYAADFKCPGFGTPEQIVKEIIASDIKFDQCIQEGSWVHISFDPAMRQQVLTAHFDGAGKATYTAGV